MSTGDTRTHRREPFDLRSERGAARADEPNSLAWKRLLIGLGSGVFVIAVSLNGCGGSSDAIEIPEAAKT